MLNNIATFEDEAENLTLQRLLKAYLPSAGCENIWSLPDTCITARRIGDRSGVPADASTWEYRLDNIELSWTVNVRAVWRCGRLMRPYGTHLAVTKLFDDEGFYNSPSALRAAFRDWLRGLPL